MPSPSVPGGHGPHVKYQSWLVQATPAWQGLGSHRSRTRVSHVAPV